MSIGLKRGKVKIVDYNPAWPKEFEKEKQKLIDVLGNKIFGHLSLEYK